MTLIKETYIYVKKRNTKNIKMMILQKRLELYQVCKEHGLIKFLKRFELKGL